MKNCECSETGTTTTTESYGSYTAASTMAIAEYFYCFKAISTAFLWIAVFAAVLITIAVEVAVFAFAFAFASAFAAAFAVAIAVGIGVFILLIVALIGVFGALRPLRRGAGGGGGGGCIISLNAPGYISATNPTIPDVMWETTDYAGRADHVDVLISYDGGRSYEPLIYSQAGEKAEDFGLTGFFKWETVVHVAAGKTLLVVAVGYDSDDNELCRSRTISVNFGV